MTMGGGFKVVPIPFIFFGCCLEIKGMKRQELDKSIHIFSSAPHHNLSSFLSSSFLSFLLFLSHD